jgi:hypothetical protein
MSEPGSNADDVAAKLQALVLERMQAGADKFAITEELVGMGVERADAAKVVDSIYGSIAEAAAAEQVTVASLVPAIAGGGLVAVAGGLLWGLIAIFGNLELGILAWGIGWAAGWAVVMFARGRKGLPLQIVAVAASLVGILIGKYMTFFSVVRGAIAAEHGAEAAADLSMFSLEMAQFFVENVRHMLSPFDLLWVALAVGTAWFIPKGMGIRSPR